MDRKQCNELDLNIELDELESFMLQAEMEELGVKLASEDDEQFTIKNKSEADFYIKLINKLRQEKEEIDTFIDAEVERQIRLYENYRKERMRPLDNQIAFYEQALKTFTINEIAESGKKTIKLPNGTLSVRKQQPKYVYDDSKILEYLEQNDCEDLIKIKKEVNKKELKKAAVINNNNELVLNDKVIPGATVIPQEDKFDIK